VSGVSADEPLYYARHGVESDPGDLRPLLDALPKDPVELIDAVGGLIVDRAFVGSLGGVYPPESADDAESRRMSAMLARIVERDAASLAIARPPDKRLVGACRHAALLACSALRHHGVSARVRVGFADYFVPGFHDDHWITEYQTGGGWRLMDPELTAGVRHHFGVTFDPCDVPRDRFLTAGQAWLGVRSGRIDPATCGVSSIGIGGPWFVAGSVVRDLAALNKREMLPWDYWGISREMRPGVPLADATVARIDAVAARVAEPDLDWDRLRNTYDADEAFRVPSVVLSFPRGVPIDVVIPD
jgi:transglutaminase superfamily protein